MNLHRVSFSINREILASAGKIYRPQAAEPQEADYEASGIES
jgi:hypothetical protein